MNDNENTAYQNQWDMPKAEITEQLIQMFVLK